MTTIMRKEWLPTDMRKVLHVGPCNTPGGMAKVIQILSQNPRKAGRLRYYHRILLRISSKKLNVWLKNRKWIKKNYKNYDVIHVHSAAELFISKKVEPCQIVTNLVFQ